jgi:hypothetical protein
MIWSILNLLFWTGVVTTAAWILGAILVGLYELKKL